MAESFSRYGWSVTYHVLRNMRMYSHHLQCMCMYGHTYSKSMDQPGKVVNPVPGQLDG